MRRLESASWWNAGMRDIASLLLNVSRPASKGTVIDIGCGSGQTMSWFTSLHPDWTAAGIDIAPEGVMAAQSAGLPVVMGNALEVPFESSSADMVITLDVLQHLSLPDGDLVCLGEIFRVLRPGGILFVRTNCQSYPRTTDDFANDFRKYEPRHLEEKLRSSGFEIERLSRVNALLGFAEVARELRATRKGGSGYHGLLAVPQPTGGLAYSAKRAVLRVEGSLIARGLRLPFGRSIVALCRRPGIG